MKRDYDDERPGRFATAYSWYDREEQQEEPGGMEKANSGIDLATLFFSVLEKIHWIALSSLLCTLIAWYYVTRMVTPVYQATSKIYIAGSDTTISLYDLQLGSSLTTDYKEVFKIWHVHEIVNEKLGLNYSYSKLAGMVSTENPKNSHLMYIHVRSSDPEEARLLADAYAEAAQEYISEKMEMRKPQILEKARTPAAPISPNVRGTIIKGFLAGSLLSTGALVLFFLIDDRIRSADDVNTAVKLPVFGQVPLQDMEKNSEDADTTIRSAIPPEHSHLADIQGKLALDYYGVESVNTICASISFVGKRMRKLAVSSCGPGEGKSFVTLQMAIGMTRRSNLRVLLIDCDLRKSVLLTRYRIRLNGSGMGLAHLLAEQCSLEDAIYETNIPNLFLMPSGALVKTPLSLLTSTEFMRVLVSLENAFDLILLDTPPLGAVVDAAEIARYCDGSMLVVEYNKTRKRALAEAVALLRQTDTPVLGCVINKMPSRHIHVYGGKYGYTYEPYAEDSEKRGLRQRIKKRFSKKDRI